MENEFDIGAAVDTIGADLGLGVASDGATDADGTDTTKQEPATFDAATGQEVSGEQKTAPEAASDAGEQKTDPVQAAADNAAPRTWRAEAAATWAAIPPAAQQEILKREQDIWKGLEGYKADAAYGKSFKQVMQPYEGLMKQYNVDPVNQVQNLMQAHVALATGTPEQKLDFIQKIAADYGIDLINAATHVPPYVDPQVAALQKQVEALQSTQSAQQVAVVQQARTKIESEIDAFAADKGNIYFEELVDDIAKLINVGAARSLKEAYDTAVWMNPTVRAKELTRQQAERDAEVLKARQAQTANARKALAANVKASAKSGSAAAPLGSIDDTLMETLSAIRGR